MFICEIFAPNAKSIIVVDVQPEYRKEISNSFAVWDLMSLLNKQSKILMFFNEDDNSLEECKAFWKKNGLEDSTLGRMKIIAKDRPQSAGYQSMVATLKDFSGSYVVGGIRDLCLKEVVHILTTNHIEFSLLDDFIYD